MSEKHKRAVSDISTQRKRKTINCKMKLDVIKRYEKGESRKEISRSLDLKRSTIGAILRDKDRILEHTKGRMSMHSTMITKKRTGAISDMEDLLILWIEDQRNQGNPLSFALIRQKALSIYNELRKSDQKYPDVEPFVASQGWCSRFQSRANIRFVGGDGKFEAGSSSQGTEILGLSDTVAKTEVEEAIYTSEPEYIIKNSPQSEDSPEEEFEPPEKQPRIPKIEEVYLPENQELEQHRSLESSDNTTSTKPPEADRDEFTVFGEYVTTTLRNLPNRYLQCVAKHKISEILFQIESQCYSALLTGNEQSAATHGSFSSQSLPSTSYAHQLSVSNIPTTH